MTYSNALSNVRRQVNILFCATVLLSILGAFFHRSDFLHAYFLGYFFWAGLGIGSLGLLLLYYLVGGRWGSAARQVLQANARVLPIWSILILPIFYKLKFFYVWANPEVVAQDAILQHKHIFLNAPFFYIRAVIYFAVWGFLSQKLYTWQRSYTTSHLDSDRLKLQEIGAMGLVVFMFLASFAAFDWFMSLNPYWGSSIYGVIIIIGQALMALSFAIVIVVSVLKKEVTIPEISTRTFHDLGNLLMALVLVWTYTGLSQYLIIWYGNLPEEITWFILRGRTSWVSIAKILVICQFVLPFLLLLIRENKRRLHVLARIAGALLVIHYIDVFWTVMPDFRKSGFSMTLLDLTVPVALGCLWFRLFLSKVDDA